MFSSEINQHHDFDHLPYIFLINNETSISARMLCISIIDDGDVCVWMCKSSCKPSHKIKQRIFRWEVLKNSNKYTYIYVPIHCPSMFHHLLIK